MPTPPPPWLAIAAEQHGVVARRQLLELGLTGSQARRHLANGQWGTLRPGVYLTTPGQLSDHGSAWAALLYGGPGAALSHGTALWLDGVLDAPPRRVHLSIPGCRRVSPQDGLSIHRSMTAAASVHPSRSPTRTRIEHAVLDHLSAAGEEVVIDVLIRATQRRLTSPARLRNTLADRTRHPHWSLIIDVLVDIADGVQSPLERRYLPKVERAHRLPAGLRNRREDDGARAKYHDVRYGEFSTVVELDGRAPHRLEDAFRDLRRDNVLALADETVLRFGWRDVVGRPCAVAAQVAEALCRHGWSGAGRACSHACTLRTAA